MKFAWMLTTSLALVSPIEALPAKATPKKPTPKNGGHGQSKEILPKSTTDICKNAFSKTPESWKKHKIGEWLVEETSHMEIKDDIQKSLQSTKYTKNIFNFYCSPISVCEANLNSGDCKKSPDTAAIYFTLQAIANFNNFIFDLSSAVTKSNVYVDGKVANMVDKFTENGDAGDLDSWGPILASGLFGALGALFAPAAIPLGLGGGIATVAVAAISHMNSMREIAAEPKFDKFGDVSEFVADSSKKIHDSLQSYARKVLTEKPKEKDYAKDPQQLPQILKDGTFAERVVVDAVPPGIYKSLFGGVVSKLWKGENAVVLKVPKDNKVTKDDPCKSKPFLDKMSYCDDDGNYYVIIKNPSEGEAVESPMEDSVKDKFKKDLKGFDDLGDYELDVETVVKGAEKSWDRNGGRPDMKWSKDQVLKDFTKDPGEARGFVPFDLTFCDVTKNDGVGRVLDNDDCNDECRLIYFISTGGCMYFQPTPPFYFAKECDFDKEVCEEKDDFDPPCLGGMAGC